MKISILTTIANPRERQDKWLEAFECYKDFANQLVVVNGSKKLRFNFLSPGLCDFRSQEEIAKDEIKQKLLDRKRGYSIDGNEKFIIVNQAWPEEWNWVELPRHLNAGLEQCTGDWVIKLDIDQFIHEKDFEAIRATLHRCPDYISVVTFQKMTLLYGKKYYQKGPVPIAFRRQPEIKIGKDINKRTDLCFPIKQTGVEVVTYEKGRYELPTGEGLLTYKGGQHFWNYDYFFKDKRFTKREFWRFSRAYHRYFKEWTFGNTSNASFKIFINNMSSRYKKAPYTYKLEDHPKYIRQAVQELIPDQFGYNGWGIVK